MPEPDAMPPNGKDRLCALLCVTAAVLWVAGVITGIAAFAITGICLRTAAIALFSIAGLRRPSLFYWTMLAMLAGVELGYDAPRVAVEIRFLGDLFLRLIRMIVAPLIFATITTGIAGHSQLRGIGRVAIKALIYFEVVTTLGLIIGATAMSISGAGFGVASTAALAVASSTAPASAVAAQPLETWQQIVLNLIPENIAQAVAQNQILQVAMFSVLFGVALALLPQPKRVPLLSVLQSLADTMFQLTRFVMYMAPLAAGAALAFTVASTGLATLLPLGRLVGTYYAALGAFCLLVLLPILVLYRIPLRRFIAAVAEPAAIGFATTTSEAALPLAMERMEGFGVPRWIVSFVIPTGYSFNMTGSSVYLSMAVIFTAQASGMHLSLSQNIAILATLMLASKGVAGVPRAVLVVLLATAGVLQLPTAPILLILGVDTLMDMGRTLMNVVGNCMASAIVARSEGLFVDPEQQPG